MTADAEVITTPIAANTVIVVGSATTCPSTCSRWLRPKRVKSGMLSDSVAQYPIIPVSDGTIPGYHAQPDGKGPYATVLVIHEAWGVHEHIKDLCRRFAKLGYYAIAPELFARQGNAAAITDPQERGNPIFVCTGQRASWDAIWPRLREYS